MGLFGWLFKRKKKEDDSGYDELDQQEYQPNINPKLDFGAGQMQPQMQQPSFDTDNREFRIINDKLDIINSKLEVINQRLNSIEQRGREERPIVQRW